MSGWCYAVSGCIKNFTPCHIEHIGLIQIHKSFLSQNILLFITKITRYFIEPISLDTMNNMCQDYFFMLFRGKLTLLE